MCFPAEQKERVELTVFTAFAAASIAGLCSFQALYFLSDDGTLQPLYWAGFTMLLGLWTKSPASIVPRIQGLCSGPESHKKNVDRVTFVALALLSAVTFTGGVATYLLDENPAKRTVALSSATGILGLWASPPGKLIPRLADALVHTAPADQPADQPAEQPATPVVSIVPVGTGILRIV